MLLNARSLYGSAQTCKSVNGTVYLRPRSSLHYELPGALRRAGKSRVACHNCRRNPTTKGISGSTSDSFKQLAKGMLPQNYSQADAPNGVQIFSEEVGFRACPEGTGLFAKKTIAPYQTLFWIPVESTIEVNDEQRKRNVTPDEAVGPIMEGNTPPGGLWKMPDRTAVQALILMDCLNGHYGPYWKEYLEVTMRPYQECCMPMCLPQSLLEEVGDSEIIEETRATQESLENAFPNLATWPSPQEPPLLFRCYGHAISHSFRSSVAPTGPGDSIVPFLDLVNHSTKANCTYYTRQVSIGSSTETVWVARNTRLLQPGEQAIIFYGRRTKPLPNQILFLNYGFVLQGYSEDTLDLPASELSDEQLSKAMAKLSAAQRQSPYFEAAKKSLEESLKKSRYVGSFQSTVDEMVLYCRFLLEEIPLRIETQEGSLQQQTTVMRYNDERRQLIFAVRAILRLCK